MAAALMLASSVVVAILTNASCNNDGLSFPYCPPSGVGTLEGYVRAAGVGIEATIRAEPSDNSGRTYFRTRSSSTGWYRLDLPKDTYRIEVNTGHGGSAVDTIQVAAGTQRFDPRFGTVTVRLQTPASLEGRTLRCSLRHIRGFDQPSSIATAQDGQLEFFLPAVSPGQYLVGVGDYSLFWLPGTYSLAAAARFTVGAESPHVFTGSLDRHASISGTVRGSWQVAGEFTPSVVAWTSDGTQPIQDANVASDGSYRIDLLAALPVKLNVHTFQIDQWIGGDALETATLFDLQPGEQLEDVTFVESGVACRLEGPGNRVSYRAQLLLQNEAGRVFRPANSFYSNPLLVTNLLPGRYAVYVYGYCENAEQSWASQWYGGAGSIETATWIDLLPGQLIPITVSLSQGGGIEGRVLRADGEPVSEIALSLLDRDGSSLCTQWLYFPGGSFRIRGLSDGEYRIAVNRGPGWWYPGTYDPEAATRIVIRNHSTVTGIEWRLPPQGEAP